MAIKYVNTTQHRDLTKEMKNWKTITIDTDSTPFGDVTIVIYLHDERVEPRVDEKIIVPKKHLL